MLKQLLCLILLMACRSELRDKKNQMAEGESFNSFIVNCKVRAQKLVIDPAFCNQIWADMLKMSAEDKGGFNVEKALHRLESKYKTKSYKALQIKEESKIKMRKDKSKEVFSSK